jgi:predicted HD phosphohydrolase
MAQDGRDISGSAANALGRRGAASLDVISQVVELLEAPGRRPPLELTLGVSPLGHALQTAQLAEGACAPHTLIAAALLHDIGHLLSRPVDTHPFDDVHELRALGLLGSAFGREVLEPIRLHVQAKRYLITTDPHHAAALPPAARASLALQGGMMSREEVCLFEDTPFAEQAVALRRWDDAAHVPGKRTPPLEHFVDVVRAVRLLSGGTPRIDVGAPDVG